MPTDLKCPHCDLRVSIGGYFIQPGKEFNAATLLACGECGTQHAVKHDIRNDGPEYFDIQKVVVDSFEPIALQRVVVRIQKFHTPKLTLPDALALARSPPFTLVESLLAEQALKLVEELKLINIQAHRKTTGLAQNPFFGLARPDRIKYHAQPQHGDDTLPWLQATGPAPENVSTMRCEVCHSAGRMIHAMPEVLTCPSCGQGNMVDIGYWLT